MMSKLAGKFHILCDYYRENGFLKLYRYVCANLFVYEKYAVFERDLSEPIQEVHTGIPVDIRLLSKDESDIEKLAEFWPVFYANARIACTKGVFADVKQMVASRLSMGEECMIAEYQGKVVHMNWLGFQNTHLFNYYAAQRGITSEEALGYNIYTAPQYRGNKVVEAVWVEIFKFLKRKGCERIINYVASQNIAAMKVTHELFKNRAGNLYYIGIFGFGKYIFRRATIG